MTVELGQTSPLTRLESWFRSPLGEAVASQECACVQQLLANTFGYYLLQIGVTDSFSGALSSSRIRQRIQVPTELPVRSDAAAVVGRPQSLPIASDSVDAALLPHTLDFVSDPKRVLSEVERVLIPEGRVIVVGFNALSSWGLRRLAWRAGGQVPWCGRFLVASRVRAWLEEQGFDVEICQRLVFCPPLGSIDGPRCTQLDRLGQRLWPALGAVYVMRAVKRVATVTPIMPPLRAARSALLTGRAVRPTTRGAGHA